MDDGTGVYLGTRSISLRKDVRVIHSVNVVLEENFFTLDFIPDKKFTALVRRWQKFVIGRILTTLTSTGKKASLTSPSLADCFHRGN